MNRDAWLRNVLLRSGRKHGWKQHARKGTLLREVLGILDAWSVRYSANEGGRRFLVAHLNTILKNCKTKKPRKKKLPSVEDFSLDRLKRILAELREQHILSKYFESNDGRFGFVMAPHDSLCHVKNGVCILQDRSEVFMPQPEPQHWSARASAAISTLRQHSTQHRENTELNTKTTPNSTPPLVIGNTEVNTELNTTGPVQLYDFTDLTDDVIAKWFANGLQTGGSIPCIRLSPVSAYPLNPSYPAEFSQEAIEHHEQFLKRTAEKQQQRQEQPQEQKLSFSSLKGNTETENQNLRPSENRKAKDENVRYKPVVPPDEYRQQRALAEMKRRSDIAKEFEPCDDRINRREHDRILFGYTIKGDDGIWHRPSDWQPSEELKKLEVARAAKKRSKL
jgi:hypothetical protein